MVPTRARSAGSAPMCVPWRGPPAMTPTIAVACSPREQPNWPGATLRWRRAPSRPSTPSTTRSSAASRGPSGQQSPFALVHEIRSWFDGFVALSGAIATGRSILAALVLGADMAYIGSLFIATHEASATQEYKAALVDGDAGGIIYSPFFS